MNRPTTNYELINQNLPLITKLINNGLVKINMMKYVEIYEKFHSLTGTNIERYDKLAEEFGVTSITIQRAVLKMKRKLR